jgi:outer membrane autotransporter protein
MQTAKSKYNAPFTTTHVEAGLKYRGGVLNLSPFVGAQYTGLTRKGFREKGAGDLNLRSGEQTYHSLRTLFGMRLDSRTFKFYNGMASIYGNVAWIYEFDQICERHTKFTARLKDNQFRGLGRYTVYGNDPGRDWVQTGFGVNYDLNPAVRTSLGYDAYANINQVMHTLNLGFVYQR